LLNNIAGLLGGAVAIAGDYESIYTTTVGSGGTSTITFNSIPSTYKHLQLRIFAKDEGSGAYNSGGKIRFNSDSGSNYTNHEMYGLGSGTPSNDVPSGANPWNGMNFVSGSANFGVTIVDILDYASTNKYKTIRHLGGVDNNGSGAIIFESGCWLSTSAVDTIGLTFDGGQDFAQYSHFALYGMKG